VPPFPPIWFQHSCISSHEQENSHAVHHGRRCINVGLRHFSDINTIPRLSATNSKSADLTEQRTCWTKAILHFVRDHLCSTSNMDLGLPFSSGCAETHQVDLRVVVKEEHIKEEEHDHMITFQHDEEKPVAELNCKTETDVIESPMSTYNETVKTEKDEEEEEKEQQCDWLLENPMSLAQMKRVSVVLVDCCRPQGRRGKEEEMQTLSNRDAHQIETSVSEHPHVTQQKIHGQNDELNLQRKRRPPSTVCRKSFTALRNTSKHTLLLLQKSRTRTETLTCMGSVLY
ncbi:hypothetical protein AALO_G00091750, partial [Alosa alosa]